MKTIELIREILDFEEQYQEVLKINQYVISENESLKKELSDLRAEYNKLAMDKATNEKKAQLVK